MFKTSFNLEMSDNQKRLKEQTMLPHMKAQGSSYQIFNILII